MADEKKFKDIVPNEDELDDETSTETDDKKSNEVTAKDDEKEGKSAETAQENHKQSSKENARFKQMRLEQEKKEREKIKDDSYVQGQLDLLTKNPYTQEPIKTKADLRIYQIQKSLEEKGKDPITDLASEIARIESEKEEEAVKAAEEKAKTQKRAEKDVQEFLDEGHSMEELNQFLDEMGKPEWKDLFGEALDNGSISPVKAYKAMQKIRKESVDSAKEKEEAKKSVITPTPNGSGKKVASIEDMTPEEINKAYEKKYGKKVN